MCNTDVPIWEKYTLTIEESSKYFRIGKNKLRKLAEESPAAGWVIMNANRIQIKRKQFEKIRVGRDLRKKNVQKGLEYAIIDAAYQGPFRLWKGAAQYVREKAGGMLTNTLIPLGNRNSSTHGS